MKFAQSSSFFLGLFLSGLVHHAYGANSTLFEGATVISFDDTTQTPRVLRDTSLLIVGDKISAIFDSSSNSTISIPPGTERIPAQDYIISPGFVDTHRHGWQTVFKTLGADTTLAQYFKRYSEYTQAGEVFTADDVYYSQLAGIWEALDSGVTSILEHGHGTFSSEAATAAVRASIDSGARLFFDYTIHTLTNGFNVSQQVATFKQLLEDDAVSRSLVEMGLAYDEWTTSSSELTQTVVDLAKKSNITSFTTHYLGGPWNFANSPSLLQQYDFLNTSFPIVFSHASFVTPQDAALLRKHNHFISTTPESEMHYGHDHFYNPEIQDHSALGIDTHFTYSTDMITQARIWLQSVRLQFFRQTLDNWKIASKSPMSTNQAFTLATRAGGLALRRPDIGVIQVGAKADIIAFNGKSPNMLGWHDPVAAIILHSHVGDIKHVLVNGQWRKRDGELVVEQNRTEVEHKFLESARRIQNVWLDTPLPDLTGEFADGIPYTTPEIIDISTGNGTGY